MPRASDRLRAYRWGYHAEGLAACALMLKGYQILAKRYHARGGEIDLVVRRGQVLAFVEVKARPRFDMALEAIDGIKCQRIGKAVNQWLYRHASRHQDQKNMILRGDAVIVVPWRWPHHIEDAFDLPID